MWRGLTAPATKFKAETMIKAAFLISESFVICHLSFDIADQLSWQ
jgi:hypothetical protein